MRPDHLTSKGNFENRLFGNRRASARLWSTIGPAGLSTCTHVGRMVVHKAMSTSSSTASTLHADRLAGSGSFALPATPVATQGAQSSSGLLNTASRLANIKNLSQKSITAVIAPWPFGRAFPAFTFTWGNHEVVQTCA